MQSTTLLPSYKLRGANYTYEILRVLGQGTFGVTYLAQMDVQVEGALGRMQGTMQVAIKEFFMRDINEREGSTVTSGSNAQLFIDYSRKFENEAKHLSQLEHSGIVNVVESFRANNTIYFVMEHLPGGSLDSLIGEKGLPEAEAVRYARQIATALQYMHAHKMLHLDLKPGNIMLDKDGKAVLIDFGLSKQYDAQGDPESSTAVGAGTPGYAPLEQINFRDGKDFPVTMDIYALGGTLFKMLTGQRPPVASEILNEGFPTGMLEQHGISARLVKVIEKAMMPIKHNRYQSVEQLMADLGKVSADESTRIEAEPESEVVVEDVRRDDVHIVSTGNKKDKHNEVQKPKRSKTFRWISQALMIVLVACIVRYAISLYRSNQNGTIEWNIKIAKQGDAETQFKLGQWYEDGHCVTQDYEKAVEWYTKAAEQEHIYAQYRLGEYYKNGQVVTKDYKKAVKWYTRAARQGDAEAQFKLALCYFRGQGVTQDYKIAVEWFTKAAEQGHTGAQYSLGGCYKNGNGVTQNYEKAVKWYTKVAEQGDTGAQCQLGRCYELGRGVTQDWDKAEEWYTKAAEGEHPFAQDLLKDLNMTIRPLF